MYHNRNVRTQADFINGSQWDDAGQSTVQGEGMLQVQDKYEQ